MEPSKPPALPGDIQLVIFDLDGVLVDSEIISAQAIIDLLARYDIRIDLLYVRRNFIGKSFSTVVSNIETNFDVKLPPKFEACYLDDLTSRFERDLEPIPGAVEVAAALKVKTCIATSSSFARAEKSLRLTGLFDHFKGRIYCSSMVLNPKPAPDLFEFACDKQGVAPARAIIIEDSVAGLEAGVAAGIETLRFVGGSHLKGLSPVNQPPEQIKWSFDSWRDFRCHYAHLFSK